ncbi:MAG: hypothetical protein HY037_02110 [Nitrospirae bacterium]|nr:hypothetical protein [Candidatus Troglogloeales bacterium]
MSATPSFALPAFARKYDLSCTSCHTKPPRLNAFGEAFHMAGFQVPMTSEGEIREKRRIGRVFSETNLLDIFSVVARGDLARYASGGQRREFSLPFPENIGIYLTGTFTDAISYFFEFEHERQDDSGNIGFGLGKEAFVMMNIPALFSGDSHTMLSHGSSLTVHGPMLMAGKIDPSTNFSYPTNRQIIEGIQSYAFASKFFGVTTADYKPLAVTRPVLYNTTGSPGIDLHAMIGKAIIQGGIMEGINANPSDENNKKDFYLMGRMDFGGASYISGSLSSFGYFGYDTARVQDALVDWRRIGIGGNLKYRFLDLYGAYVEDTLQNLPSAISSDFDKNAAGFTVEGDYLTTDRLLLSLRYDHLRSGGTSERQDGSIFTLQSRYYLRDNFSFYLRNSTTTEFASKNLIASGLSFDF